jgi:hypothetical protein
VRGYRLRRATFRRGTGEKPVRAGTLFAKGARAEYNGGLMVEES